MVACQIVLSDNTILWLVDRYLGSETTFNNTSKIKYISLMVTVTH